jgi:hypothetical protein
MWFALIKKDKAAYGRQARDDLCMIDEEFKCNNECK